ncbi:bone morphogenetic protein 8B-like [Mastomys coucha]|uniref:bone morphogenetic protein 8B-like n=1 Tax=Mastomys coucha TaxID=35658 RepID=UPI00126172C2|nr:bone morphogenetic protein 8B-like [Mastomys coucha]
MAAGPRLLWLLGLALCVLGGGHLPRPPHVFPQRRLGVREPRDMQREIREVLGLPGRPRSRAPLAAAQQPASAPLFMLDLYHAMTDDTGGGPPQPHLDRADLIMSFVNIGECGKGPRVSAVSTEPDLFFLDLQTLRSMDEGWLVLDITAASDRWLLNHHKDLGLRLYVETAEGHSMDPGLAGLLGRQAPRSRQPFMVGFFRGSRSSVRAPRTARPPKKQQQLNRINQLPHSNKHLGIFDDGHGSRGREVCRRHELYVSFRDLGWLDSVIAPQGYSAYYCAGECIYPLNSCMNSTKHATMQALVHLMKPDIIPKVCCVPTELSAISLLYYDRNNNVILRRERNMVVQACGCH